MHRAQTASRWQAFSGRAAEMLGVAARKVGQSATEIVGLPGAALVSFGAGQIYAPLLPIVAGAFLLAIARHMR